MSIRGGGIGARRGFPTTSSAVLGKDVGGEGLGGFGSEV